MFYTTKHWKKRKNYLHKMFFIKTKWALHWGDSQKNQRKLRLGKKHKIIQAWSSLSRKWMRGFSRDNDMWEDEEEDYPDHVLGFSIESRMVCRWKNYQLHNKCVQNGMQMKWALLGCYSMAIPNWHFNFLFNIARQKYTLVHIFKLVYITFFN